MPKYIKQDSEKGFIEDYVEIQSQKFNNVRHVVLDNMLGDFDEAGFYCVHPDIVKELIEMPKYIVEVMDNLEVCLSSLKLDKQISFLIAYEGEKATLSLLEKVNFEANNKLGIGSWSNVNEYVLDSVETSGEIDRQALYLKWNVQTFAGEIIDIFNCEESVLAKYFNIVNRFKENLVAKTTLLEVEEKLEENEAEYFLDLMEILKGYPELNKLVQNELKQTLNEKKAFVKLDKPNFVKTLNEIVEKAIESNIKTLPENQKDSFNVEKRNITLKKNIKNYDVVQFSTEQINNENERVENLENSHGIEQNDTQTIIKIQADNGKFGSLQKIADEFAQTEKRVNDKKKSGATAVITGGTDADKQSDQEKAETDSGHTSKGAKGELNKRLKEILGIIQGLGVNPHVIVSAGVIGENLGKENVEKTETLNPTAKSGKEQSNKGVGATGGGGSNKKETGKGRSGGNRQEKKKGSGEQSTSTKEKPTTQNTETTTEDVNNNNSTTTYNSSDSIISRRVGTPNAQNGETKGNGTGVVLSGNDLKYEWNVTRANISTNSNKENETATQETQIAVETGSTQLNDKHNIETKQTIHKTITHITGIGDGIDRSL